MPTPGPALTHSYVSARFAENTQMCGNWLGPGAVLATTDTRVMVHRMVQLGDTGGVNLLVADTSDERLAQWLGCPRTADERLAEFADLAKSLYPRQLARVHLQVRDPLDREQFESTAMYLIPNADDKRIFKHVLTLRGLAAAPDLKHDPSRITDTLATMASDDPAEIISMLSTEERHLLVHAVDRDEIRSTFVDDGEAILAALDRWPAHADDSHLLTGGFLGGTVGAAGGVLGCKGLAAGATFLGTPFSGAVAWGLCAAGVTVVGGGLGTFSAHWYDAYEHAADFQRTRDAEPLVPQPQPQPQRP